MSDKEEKPKMEMPKIDISKLQEIDFDLHSLISKSVSSTNSFLASLQTQKTATESMVASRVRPLVAQLRYGLERGVQAYERRQYYGTEIVAGTSALVTTVVGLRRGKIPGVFMGALTGFGAYSFVYGQDKIESLLEELKKQA